MTMVSKILVKLLHITEEEFNSILEPSKREHSHHKYNYQISEIKPLIAKDISDNYNRLRSKFIGNTTNLQLSQTDEDIFHNTLLKVISEGIEDGILDQIEYRIKMLRYQTKMDHKQLKKLFTNAISKEACQTEE